MGAQQLDGYGQECFLAKDETGSEVLIGASLTGIVVRWNLTLEEGLINPTYSVNLFNIRRITKRRYFTLFFLTTGNFPYTTCMQYKLVKKCGVFLISNCDQQQAISRMQRKLVILRFHESSFLTFLYPTVDFPSTMHQVRRGNALQPQFFKWHDITNLVNHKRLFGVECQNYQFSVQFLLDEADSAKYVWKMCVLQHTFYKVHAQVSQFYHIFLP